MNKEQIKLATFDDFIHQKLKRDKQKESQFEIYITSMDKNLMCKYPSDEIQLDFMNKLGTGEDAVSMIEAFKELIYFSCPVFQDKALHSELGVVDPIDVIPALFSIAEISEIGGSIAEKLNPSKLVDDLKN